MRAIGRLHALAEGGRELIAGRVTGWPARLIHWVDVLISLGGLLDRLVDRGFGLLASFVRNMKRYGGLYRMASVAEKFLLPSGDARGGVPSVIPEIRRDAMWYNSDRGQEPSIFLRVVEKRQEAILEMAKHLDGLPREAAESGSLGEALGKLWSILNRSVEASRSSWNVLNHGDLWINNMLFRYQKSDGTGEGVEKPNDVKLIDLQFTRYCHPGIDLLYFLYTSTHRSFRERHFDLLISEYHSSLTRTLRAVGRDHPPMSLADLKSDLRGKLEPFGVIIGTFFAPYLKLDPEVVESSSQNIPLDAHKVFVEDGNSSCALRQFFCNSKFRWFMEDNIRELTEVIFPNGLGSANPHWM